MVEIPSTAYAPIGVLLGAIIGAAVTFVSTRWTQRAQRALEREKLIETRAQSVFKEKAEKFSQFAIEITAASYSFLWLTWSASHKDLDQDTLNLYWDEIQHIMPRLYGGYLMLAALDDDLGKTARDLFFQADQLDVSIGEAAVKFDGEAVQRLAELRPDAQRFAADVLNDLASAMQRKRIEAYPEEKV